MSRTIEWARSAPFPMVREVATVSLLIEEVRGSRTRLRIGDGIRQELHRREQEAALSCGYRSGLAVFYQAPGWVYDDDIADLFARRPGATCPVFDDALMFARRHSDNWLPARQVVFNHATIHGKVAVFASNSTCTDLYLRPGMGWRPGTLFFAWVDLSQTY